MFEKDDKIIVKNIMDSFDNIFSETEKISYEEFKSDSAKVRTVLSEIESIGDNCKNITGEFRLSNEEVNWNYIIKTRRRLSHKIISAVNTDVLWALIKEDYPGIRDNISKLLTT
ncbi:MAG: DUF86 domain-containing protein [Bacteroidetes bacterium]|nr:DUF86 domain-containing protein [Bacteroidota bacterium]